MRDNKPNSADAKQAFLIGIGLDNQDGHKRMTQAEDFAIVGGSQDTHDKMTETLVKTCEDIKRKGKRLVDVEREELSELIEKNRPE